MWISPWQPITWPCSVYCTQVHDNIWATSWCNGGHEARRCRWRFMWPYKDMHPHTLTDQPLNLSRWTMLQGASPSAHRVQSLQCLSDHVPSVKLLSSVKGTRRRWQNCRLCCVLWQIPIELHGAGVREQVPLEDIGHTFRPHEVCLEVETCTRVARWRSFCRAPVVVLAQVVDLPQPFYISECVKVSCCLSCLCHAVISLVHLSSLSFASTQV